jgi:hypothetical protein
MMRRATSPESSGAASRGIRSPSNRDIPNVVPRPGLGDLGDVPVLVIDPVQVRINVNLQHVAPLSEQVLGVVTILHDGLGRVIQRVRCLADRRR